MPSRNWRFGAGIATGGVIAFVLFKVVELCLLYVGDAAPRLTQRWTPVITTVGALTSGIFGLAVPWFVARSSSGPVLLRRIGISGGVFGMAVALGGVVLFLMPAKPPVHPGRMAAGDVAAGSTALLVLFAGAILVAMAALVVLATLGWSWLRRRRKVAPGAS